MTRAWEIAKEGQSNFGGKVNEYLSESLKMAWAETKTMPKERIICTANHDERYFDVSVEINGQIKDCYEKLDQEQFNDKYSYMRLKHGIETISFYVVKNGKRNFLENKAA